MAYAGQNMIFAIVAVDNPEVMTSVLATVYPGEHLNIARGQWLVADRVTAKEVSDKLGMTDGSNGGGLGIAFSAYLRSQGQRSVGMDQR